MATSPTPAGEPLGRVPPLAPAWSTISRVIEHRALQYRRTFRASLFSPFGVPVLFLAAMGLGLGGYVDQNPDPTLQGLTYLQFLAPGFAARSCRRLVRGRLPDPWRVAVEQDLPRDVRDADPGALTWPSGTSSGSGFG